MMAMEIKLVLIVRVVILWTSTVSHALILIPVVHVTQAIMFQVKTAINVRLIWILIAKLAQAQLHVVLVPQDGDLSDHIAVKTTNIGILVSLLLQALVLTVQVSILLAHRVIMQTLVPPAPHQWYRLVDNAYVLMADIMMLQLLPVLFAQA